MSSGPRFQAFSEVRLRIPPKRKGIKKHPILAGDIQDGLLGADKKTNVDNNPLAPIPDAADEDDEELEFPIRLSQIGYNDGNGTHYYLPDHKHIDMVVYPFHDIELVKHMLLRELNHGSGSSRKADLKVGDIEIFHNGFELPNRRLMIAFLNQMDKAASQPHVLKWRVKESRGRTLVSRGVRTPGGLKIASKDQEWLKEINAALRSGAGSLKLTSEGTGGTYIVRGRNNKAIAIFKPRDEEPFTPNNPRKYIGEFGQPSFRPGVLSGEGSPREVAAYLLDACYGSFSNVPPTILVELIHPQLCYDPNDANTMREDDALFGGLLRRKKKGGAPITNTGQPTEGRLAWKTGSLQQFVNAKETAADYDPSLFGVGDVHRIAILDIRLANMDRNDGNILLLKNDDLLNDFRAQQLFDTAFMREHSEYAQQAQLTPDGKPSKFRLVPIDHGLTLPSSLDIMGFDLNWLEWPQSRLPFSKEELEYIENLKPDSDAAWVASKLEIRPACLRVMQVTTRLLKRGARHGLTLAEIGSIMIRYERDEPSPLEKVIRLALSQAGYAAYATALVHRRGPSTRFAMDLEYGQQLQRNKNALLQRPPGDFRDISSSAGGTSSFGEGEASSNASNSNTFWIGSEEGKAVVESARKRIVPRDDEPEEDDDDQEDTEPDNDRCVGAGDDLDDELDDDAAATDTATNASKPKRKESAKAAVNLDRLAGFGIRDDELRRTNKQLKNFTAWRAREENKASEINKLWSTEDSRGGHKMAIDWSDPNFQRLFFDSLDNVLDFLINEKFGKKRHLS